MAPRKTVHDPLIGITDIGRMLGVSKQRAGQLMDQRTNPAAPDPEEQMARGRVWRQSKVIRYARETLKREVAG